MGHFKPIFHSVIDVSEKEQIEKAFEKIYQKNKEYFEKFSAGVDVNFNAHLIPIVYFLTNDSISEEEKQQHIKKIQSLIKVVLQSL